MLRLSSQIAAMNLAATVSFLAISAASAQNANPIDLEKIEIHNLQETADGPVEGYVANRSRAGTKTDTPLIKTPQAVSVVPSQQIEDQDARSVSQALRYTAGVATEYRGSSNLRDEMYIRGFGYVPRYVNGLEFGWSSLGQINPYVLERIEVLKGPASILYGQANPGGIVNLVTKKPTGQTRREIELTTGIDARIGGAFDFQGTFDKEGVWSYRVAGIAERFDLEEDGLSQEGMTLAPSIRWAPTDDTSLTLTSLISHEPKAGFRNFREANGTLYATSHGFIPNDFNITDPDFEEFRRTQVQIGYEFEHRFNETFQFRQKAAYNIFDTYQ
ncbi:MAG: TonB-dependent receptor plug domain-containing protein, partial [Pseudomonadota bacterium]